MLNKVQLIGRLGRNPEIRFTDKEIKVATFSLATNEYWKNEKGEKQEKTEWHNIVIFGKLSEIVEQYLKKGELLYVEGKIRSREYVNKEGVKKYLTEIVADEIKMLGGKKNEDKQEDIAVINIDAGEVPF